MARESESAMTDRHFLTLIFVALFSGVFSLKLNALSTNIWEQGGVIHIEG